MELPWWANLAYLVASVLFILGMKGLTHPRTAVRGNLMSAMGMLIAVVVTCTKVQDLGWAWVILGLIVGGGIGAVAATRVPMTGMPQMVAIFNGFGGGASIGVAWSELITSTRLLESDLVTLSPPAQTLIACAVAGVIGSVTFFGSFIAYAKLQEWKSVRGNVVFPAHQLINALLALVTVGLGLWIVLQPGPSEWVYLPLIVVSAVLGVMLVLPIGGADMPVVIALLNSYSGLAAAATGFAINNYVLIIAGSLVGASGLILTNIMCKAMNRSLVNVLFGRIDAEAATATADEIYEGKIKATSADEIAMMLDGVQRVVVVPGYGMAVAQAQHAVRDLYKLLEERGVNVEFAIHPVAGRMPGHMNVLLAEVDIPYEKLIESDTINSTLETADVCIVVGANDVVNPDARNADSPIAGMPIVDVDKSRTVIIVKRSLSPGFAGIPNPLFAYDNTLMYFSDGKKAMIDLVQAIKES